MPNNPIRPIAVVLALAYSISIFAKEESTLAPVIVTTATRTDRDITTTPAPIQLISEDDIQATGATSLREVLEQSPALYVSPSGTNLQIRGLGHSDTVYLLNGRRLKGEFSNAFELERIAASMIERIEILRGPSSLLYGSDALGGVVNIITRRPVSGYSAGVDIQYGANQHGNGGRGSISAHIGGGDERLRYVFYANSQHRDPYAENETVNVTVAQSGNQIRPSAHPNAQIRNRLKNAYAVDVEYRDKAHVDTMGTTLEWSLTPALKMGFDLNYLQEKRESSFISSRYPTNVLSAGKPIQASNIPARQFDDNNRIDTAMTVDWKAYDTIDLRYRFSYGRYEKDRAVYALPYADLSYTSQEASVSSINRSILEQSIHELGAVWRPAPGHTLSTGIEYRNNDAKTSAYNTDTRSFRSVFAQHEGKVFESLNFVYGLRHDVDSVGGGQLSGQAGAVWKMSPLFRLRANYAQGYKAPDDRTLYTNQVNPQGIPMLGASVISPENGKKNVHTLKPEISETFELGVAGGGHRWSYGLTAFNTTVENRIEQVREGTAPLTYNTFRNISEARIRGIEADGSVPISANMRARFSATLLRTRNNETGAKLLNTPQQLARFSLDYSPTNRWMLQTIVRHVGKQNYSGTVGTSTASGYTMLDIKANYFTEKTMGMEIYGGINNLLNEKVDTALGSDPGPYVYVGMRYRF